MIRCPCLSRVYCARKGEIIGVNTTEILQKRHSEKKKSNSAADGKAASRNPVVRACCLLRGMGDPRTWADRPNPGPGAGDHLGLIKQCSDKEVSDDRNREERKLFSSPHCTHPGNVKSRRCSDRRGGTKSKGWFKKNELQGVAWPNA